MKPIWYRSMRFWNRFAGPFNLYVAILSAITGRWHTVVVCGVLTALNLHFYWHKSS